MDKVLVHTTWGPTDPTRAGIAFTYAMAAKAEDMDVTMFLFHDAVLLANKVLYPKVVPIGPPPLTASIDFLVDENVKIYVCKPCFELRGLSAEGMVPTAELAGMNLFVELSRTMKVVGF
jgi:predicted peroxiredoxin